MSYKVEIRIDVWAGKEEGKLDLIPHTYLAIIDDGKDKPDYAGFSPIDIGLIDNGKIDRDFHEYNKSLTKTINITDQQYNSLMDFITQSEVNPPSYNLLSGAQCTVWATQALGEAGIIPKILTPDTDLGLGDLVQTLMYNPYTQAVGFSLAKIADIDPSIWLDYYFPEFVDAQKLTLEQLQTQINQSTNQANQFIAPPVRRDPLAFDLDGDGIEITNTNNGVMFDHNNNNVKTNTAWLSGNDAWLTLDKNKNGVIDNGAELFGDNTIKQDGTTAKDGIDALKDLDNNQDGIINNQDIQFANLKLWQDTNQDGISQQTELKTLSELGIKSIDLTRTGKNQQLTDAIQSDGLTFTKTDGTLGEVAELDLNQNEFLKAA
jgi:hypothetical protein